MKRADADPVSRTARRRGPRSLVALLLAGLLVLGAAFAGVSVWQWWRERDRTPLTQALAMAPPDAVRHLFTDWSAVRAELGTPLDLGSPTADLRAMLQEGFARDLTAASSLVTSAETLHERFGFSPASIEWELLSQGEGGASVLMRLPDDTDFDLIAESLQDVGLAPTAEDDVFGSDGDLVSGLTPVSPELSFIGLDRERHLLVGSSLVSDVVAAREAAAAGDLGALPHGVRDAAAAAEGSSSALVAAVYARDYVCTALAMGRADESEQEAGESLIEQAGRIDPLAGYAMAVFAEDRIRVALAFESDEQARRNADPRAALAVGAAPGQGGTFTERFALGEVRASGRVVTMDLTPEPNTFVFSDLGSGPVLFAAC